MASEFDFPNFTPQPTQGSGHPTRDETHRKWRNSVLVGPQTAGLPTVHNEDEWVFDSDTLASNDDMVPFIPHSGDNTGGAIAYNHSQRRRK